MRTDAGLLILRLGAGLMMLGHGYGKLVDLVQGNLAFADPLGIGPVPSKILATFAEFLCSLLVIVGFRTRWTAIPVAFTMLVAAFVVHAADPWPKKELALVYAVCFVSLAVLGGGRFGLDGLLGGGKKRKA
jgi:putative oxidoreductase